MSLSMSVPVSMGSMTMTCIMVTSSMMIMTSVAVMSMMRGSNRDLEVVPCQVGEDAILDVPAEVTLL